MAADSHFGIITAWRADLADPAGRVYREAVRRRLNDEANRKLMSNIRLHGLSSYPVVGAGRRNNGAPGRGSADEHAKWGEAAIRAGAELRFNRLIRRKTGDSGRAGGPAAGGASTPAARSDAAQHEN